MPTEDRVFTGDGKRHDKPLDGAWSISEKYRADDPLVEAVNMALALRRPLLLEGDPGSGKTRLAYAAAWELGWPLHTCYVRSTSRAEELLYEFEQLNRLYDIQSACAVFQGKSDVPKPREKTEYLTFKPLGQAVMDSAEDDRPSVVLIDEIDKADIDFPNDLLQVLEEWRFSVKEIADKESGKPMEIDALKGKDKKERRNSLPLVIVTSNREKELPPAFLRRCLYFFIEFPNQDKLAKILSAHFDRPIDERFETALGKFLELRGTDKGDEPISWRKKPGASELIDWVTLLENNGFSSDALKNRPIFDLPFQGSLVKSQADLEALGKIRTERNG